MAVPKKRNTKSRRDKKRMHIFLSKPCPATCSKCGKEVLPHIVCSNCGYYKGMEVIDVFKKLDKKEKKEKEKELASKEEKAPTMEELAKK